MRIPREVDQLLEGDGRRPPPGPGPEGSGTLLDERTEGEIARVLNDRGLLNPSDTGIPMQLARCHRGLGEYDQAVSLLLEALKESPYGPRTNYEMALTYEAMGRMEEARTHISENDD